MAIYHFDVSITKRAKGQSAVAKAAYNSRSQLVDIRTGKKYDYGRKSDLAYSAILLPENAPLWANNREKLWGQAELAENRKDSQTARQIVVALPRELSLEQNIELVRSFASQECVCLGMAADINLHEMNYGMSPRSENFNPHAHILLTMRELSADGFVAKKNRDWNKRQKIADWRVAWQDCANEALSKAGFDARIDHRSLKDKGSLLIPQIHLGSAAISMQQRGIVTEKIELYNSIKATNQKLIRQLELARDRDRTWVEKPKPKLRLKPLSAPVVNEPVFERGEELSKLDRLVELYYGDDRSAISEDAANIQKLENIRHRPKSNSMLTNRLLDRNYTPEQIRRMLIHSLHTRELSFDETQRDLNDNYQLALGVRRNQQAASCSDSSASSQQILEFTSQHNLSIAKVLFALATRQSEARTLKQALLSIGLDFSYSSKLKTFTLYEEGMPRIEYISGYYKTHNSGVDGRIAIIKDNLPSSLKSEVMDALFEFGFTASKRRRCPNSLKQITAEAEYGCKIPPSLLTLNRSKAKIIEPVKLDESDQQTVAVYYKPVAVRYYPDEQLFDSESVEIATPLFLDPSVRAREERLKEWLQPLIPLSNWTIYEKIIDNSPDSTNKPVEQEQPESEADSVSNVEAAREITLELQTDPQEDKLEQGRQLAKIAAEILARCKQTQFQFNQYAIKYDSKQGRIEIENQFDQQSVLIADHNYNPDRWVVPENWNVDLTRTEITDDFVLQLLTALKQSESLTATCELTSSERILRDVRALKRLETDFNRRFCPNSTLAWLAISKGYELERIKRILVHSKHTESLSPDEARQSIDDAYRLAVAIKQNEIEQNEKSLLFDLQSEPTDWFDNDDLDQQNQYIGKIEISITDMIIGLLRESTTTSRLRNALKKFHLDISHSVYMGVFTIYEFANPYKEYVAACTTDSGIKIVSDHLPKALKLSIFAELSKIEIPCWLPEYFDHLKFLKHKALRKGENHYHPFALVSVAEVRVENELPASDLGKGFDRALAVAASQELVAIYSKSQFHETQELSESETIKSDLDREETFRVNDSPNSEDSGDSGDSHGQLPEAVVKALLEPLERIKKRKKLNEQLARFTIAESNSYLESLGIKIHTIINPRFKGTIFTNDKDIAIFPHQNQNETTGYQGIAENFNRFSKYGTKSLWQSNFQSGDRHLVIVQSPIDALAYHQLYNKPHTRYVAVGNAVESTQLKLIDDLVRSFIRQRGTVIAAINNDLVGEQIVKQLVAQFLPYLIKRVKPKKLSFQQDLLEQLKLEPYQNSGEGKLVNRFEDLDNNEQTSQSVKKTYRDRDKGYGE